jgi:hypothetical protein
MTNEFEVETITGIHFLEIFIKYAGVSKTIVTDTMPLIVLDQYEAKVVK